MRLYLPDFSIEQIAYSGQCFRIDKVPNKKKEIRTVAAFDRTLKIEQLSPREYFFDCSKKDYKDIWFEYFDLSRDYSDIKKQVLAANDPFLTAAVSFGDGIRVLKQDLWEVIVSFIISQRNNIQRIKSAIKKLCQIFQNRFPSPTDLIQFREGDFRKLGLGYRAPYLCAVVQAVNNGTMDLRLLKTLSYHEATAYLRQFKGVGEKVANCIALYGLHIINAFPVDIWMTRIIEKYYNGHFPIQKFAKYAGIIQQYMFFYERSINKVKGNVHTNL